MPTHDPTNEKNCLTVLAEVAMMVLIAIILGAFCAWSLFLSPEWMR